MAVLTPEKRFEHGAQYRTSLDPVQIARNAFINVARVENGYAAFAYLIEVVACDVVDRQTAFLKRCERMESLLIKEFMIDEI